MCNGSCNCGNQHDAPGKSEKSRLFENFRGFSTTPKMIAIRWMLYILGVGMCYAGGLHGSISLVVVGALIFAIAMAWGLFTWPPLGR